MPPVSSFHIHLYGPHESDEPLSAPAARPLPSDFESAQRRLEQQLPGVLFEPDGSFAWAGSDFQIVGIVYDAADAIQYVELRGRFEHRGAESPTPESQAPGCESEITSADGPRIGGRLRELIAVLAGTVAIDRFAVMVLPNRQWQLFQSFENSSPPD
jgi:hypothetical protein